MRLLLLAWLLWLPLVVDERCDTSHEPIVPPACCLVSRGC